MVMFAACWALVAAAHPVANPTLERSEAMMSMQVGTLIEFDSSNNLVAKKHQGGIYAIF